MFYCSAGHIRAAVRQRMTAQWVSTLSRNASARAGRKNSSGRKIRPAKANRHGKQDARADGMTGDRATGSARQSSKDVPQFAPNFAVYVLPPDVVCLYSEDRKFFLHGELYCALASAIGKGGKSIANLVAELERDFPSDKIKEALQRLIERRYVVPASPSS